MITLTLFDIVAIIGLRPTGETFDHARINKAKTIFTFAHSSYITYIKNYYALTENVSIQEHITFLTYCLCHYVCCSSSLQVAKKFIPLATQHYEWRNICLRNLIVYGAYESLVISSRDLKEMVDPKDKFLISDPIWLLQLRLNDIFEPSPKTNIAHDPKKRV